MTPAPTFIMVLFVGVVFSQTHTNDHQKISELQTEFDRMKTDFEDFKNRTSTEIQQLRDRNSFLASVQSTNVQTLNMLMTDVFKIRAKLGFITMDSVQQNSSLDIVLDAIQRLDKLNTTIGGDVLSIILIFFNYAPTVNTDILSPTHSNEYIQKTIRYEKYQRVSRPVRADDCLIFFHTEVFKTCIVLKILSLKFIVDIPETVRFCRI